MFNKVVFFLFFSALCLFSSLHGCNEGCNPDCLLEKVVGPCKAYMPRYFYNTTSGSCEGFIYGGCRGNGNRFANLTDCNCACGCC